MKKGNLKIIIILFLFASSSEDSFPKMDSLKGVRLSAGIGFTTSNKIFALYSIDLLAKPSKNFFVGLSYDYYHLKPTGDIKKYTSITLDALYNGTFKENKFDYFLGGGVFTVLKPNRGFPFTLNGYFRIDYNISNSFASGLICKLPLLFGGSDYSGPIMLFNFAISYKIN